MSKNYVNKTKRIFKNSRIKTRSSNSRFMISRLIVYHYPTKKKLPEYPVTNDNDLFKQVFDG